MEAALFLCAGGGRKEAGETEKERKEKPKVAADGTAGAKRGCVKNKLSGKWLE